MGTERSAHLATISPETAEAAALDDRYENKYSDRGPLTRHEVLAMVNAMVVDAERYIQSDVSPQRLKNWHYYHEQVYKPAQKGRSDHVLTEVRDTVEQIMPPLMDALASDETIVAFQGPDQLLAWQATMACNHIFWNENDGWCLAEDHARDALVSKIGIFKVFVDESQEVAHQEYDISPQQLQMLAADDDVEILEITYQGQAIQELPENVLPTQVHVVTRTTKAVPRYKIETVPPEEFLINRNGTSTNPGDFKILGQRARMTVSDAVGMGVPFEIAKRYGGDRHNDYRSQEREARRDYTDEDEDNTYVDIATRPILIWELYAYFDSDIDGLAELHKILALGDGPAYIFEDKIVDDHPYCVSPSIAIPHQVIGTCPADNTTSIQDVNTAIMRETLDNIRLNNSPQREAVRRWLMDEKQLLNPQFNGIIWASQPNAVREMRVPYTADESLKVLEWMDQRKEQRTGVGKQTAGLDPQALQSQVDVGVRSVLRASQRQILMMVSVLAERAYKPLFRKLLHLLVQRQDRLTIRIGNRFLEVDPRSWSLDMRAEAQVGLRAGSKEEKQASLAAIAQRQEQILLNMGAQNPLVSLAQYSYTLQTMTAMQHVGPPEFFWQPLDQVEQKAQQMEQEAAQRARQPPPEVIKAQQEMQFKAQQAQQEMQLERAKDQADIETERIKNAVNAELERRKQDMEAMLERREQDLKAELQEREMRLEASLERMAIELKAAMGQAAAAGKIGGEMDVAV